MAPVDTDEQPQIYSERSGDALRCALTGAWMLRASRLLELKAEEIVALGREEQFVVLDLSGLAALDTAGAWIINRARHELARAGAGVAIVRARPEHDILLEEAHFRLFERKTAPRTNLIVDALADLGADIYGAVKELCLGLVFLGEFIEACLRILRRPQLFRLTSLVCHIENFGLRGIPIIALINFLVGGIVAQQGILQLQRFGASSYTVDLIGILVLRELGVLLTSIMIAGRSGSSITAEIGSMKMREEIDALRVMGLSPIEVLIAPRIFALIFALPMLAFIADMAALFGGLIVSWGYGGISPAAFLALLQGAIKLNTFLVGLIKAPFMALVIGVVAAMDGLATKGSAESLGRQVTNSVVKSIFMVIVLDGLFAIFFAAIDY